MNDLGFDTVAIPNDWDRRGLPAWAYHSQAMFDLERDAVFLTVPGENLAVVAGLLGGLSGTVVGGYGGFRFGASLTGKDPQSVKVTNTPADPVLVEEGHP